MTPITLLKATAFAVVAYPIIIASSCFVALLCAVIAPHLEPLQEEDV